MRNHNPFCSIAVTSLFLLLNSCITSNIPSQWLPEAQQLPSDFYGGWVEVRSSNRTIMGELIAITDDSVFVADSALLGIEVVDIISLHLVTYDRSSLIGYIMLGTLSTFTNGLFLMLTGPMWLIGGTIAEVSRSYDPILIYPKTPLNQFVPYARYPQGMPHDLDRASIKMKSLK